MAALSIAATTAEGLLYYADCENLFFRVLLTLENAVKAFTFHSPIDLEEARSFDDPTFLRAAAGCVYMAAVFIAPYCAVAALCRGPFRGMGALRASPQKTGNGDAEFEEDPAGAEKRMRALICPGPCDTIAVLPERYGGRFAA